MGVRKMAEWIGLVVDDRYRDERTSTDVANELTEDVYVEENPRGGDKVVTPLPQQRQRFVPVAQPEPETEAADLSRIVSIRPRSFNEVRVIGEHFRDGVPVIMNLSDMEEGDDRRLVDFAAGLIFGLRGNIERVASKVFLLCPQNIVVGPEDKQRLANGGFFNQS